MIIKEARELIKKLNSEEDKNTFLWNMVTKQLIEQPDDNLIKVRKMINKVLKDREKLRKNV